MNTLTQAEITAYVDLGIRTPEERRMWLALLRERVYTESVRSQRVEVFVCHQSAVVVKPLPDSEQVWQAHDCGVLGSGR